jgi:hypothetical protein
MLPLPFVFGGLLSLLPYYGLVTGLIGGVVNVPATLALVGMHAVFGLLAVFFRQRWWIAFTNPVREVCWWWILLRSVVLYHRRGLVWRGRHYSGPG